MKIPPKNQYAKWPCPDEKELLYVGERLFRQARNKIRKNKFLHEVYHTFLSKPTRWFGSATRQSFRLGYLGKKNRGELDSIPGAAWCAGKDYRRAEEQLGWTP